MSKPWVAIGRYGSGGIEFVLTILILGGLGQWLDTRYFGGHGWGLLVGFLLGVAVGFLNMVRTANGMQRDIEREEARNPAGSRWTVDKSWLHPEDPKGADGAHADGAPDEEAPGDDGRPPRGPGA